MVLYDINIFTIVDWSMKHNDDALDSMHHNHNDHNINNQITENKLPDLRLLNLKMLKNISSLSNPDHLRKIVYMWRI